MCQLEKNRHRRTAAASTAGQYQDFLPEGVLFSKTSSGSGFQVSLYGLAGVLLAVDEGFELNVLGLNIGVDAGVPALKLPAIGRVGLNR